MTNPSWKKSISLVLFFLVLLGMGMFFLKSDPKFISAKVQPHVDAVIRAQLWSRISGSYWENEMAKQYSLVSNSVPDRIEFLKGVLLYLKLDSLRSMTFLELASKDAAELTEVMTRFAHSPQFEELSAAQREEVKGWISDLKNEALANQDTNSSSLFHPFGP